MFENQGLGTRLRRVIRRLWWLIPLGAVVMVAFTLVVGGVRRYAATSTVFIGEVQSSPVATSEELVVLQPQASLDFGVVAVAGAVDDAEAALDTSLTADVSLLPTERLITIRTTADSATNAEQATGFLVERLREEHFAQLETNIASLTAALDARIEGARDALDAVDNQLVTATGAEATGIAIERAARTSQILDLEGQKAALNSVIAESPPPFTVNEDPAVAVLGLTRLALAAVLGALAALVVLTAVAWLDRRIWDHHDLERNGFGDLLGVVGPEADSGVEALAAAIRHGVGDRGDRSTVQLVPARPDLDLMPLASALTTELDSGDRDFAVRVTPALSAGATALVEAQQSATVLVAQSGTVTADELNDQLRQFDTVGAGRVGIVLTSR